MGMKRVTMKTKKQTRDLADFKASLREGVKYARGRKAKVKVETLLARKNGVPRQ